MYSTNRFGTGGKRQRDGTIDGFRRCVHASASFGRNFGMSNRPVPR